MVSSWESGVLSGLGKPLEVSSLCFLNCSQGAGFYEHQKPTFSGPITLPRYEMLRVRQAL